MSPNFLLDPAVHWRAPLVKSEISFVDVRRSTKAVSPDPVLSRPLEYYMDSSMKRGAFYSAVLQVGFLIFNWHLSYKY